MLFFLIIGGVVTSWAFLTIIGDERTRLIQDAKRAARRAAEAAALDPQSAAAAQAAQTTHSTPDSHPAANHSKH